MRARAGLLALVLVIGIGGPSALAYRPFGGTDAAVAAPGEFEAEIGPLGYLREGRDKSPVVPQGVLNLGVRRADVGGHTVDEVRAGLTFSLLVW